MCALRNIYSRPGAKPPPHRARPHDHAHRATQNAYLAFRKAQQTHPAPTLDGLTPDDQFFIGWVQFRGDETRPETQRMMIQADPHPVAKYRVIGPLSNMPELAKAFGCKTDAAMVRI